MSRPNGDHLRSAALTLHIAYGTLQTNGMGGITQVAEDNSAENNTSTTVGNAAQTATETVTQQPAQQPPAQQTTHTNTNSPGAQVLAALESLPERVAKAVSEAFPKPDKPKEPKTTTTETKVEKPAEPQGGHLSVQQRLVKWWWGG